MIALLLVTACFASHRDDFNDFLKKFEKEYETVEEFEYRFRVYVENLKRIAWIQLADPMAKYEVNMFADLSHEEFAMYKGYRPVPQAKEVLKVDAIKDAPDSFDWRDKGVVTPVKNQGQCGSCWSFAATGAVESKLAIKSGKLLTLSEQQLVDCDKKDEGCQGGLPESAYQYIVSAGGLESEQDYAYKATEGSCSFNADKVVARIAGSSQIPADEEAMRAALLQEGPLSIGLNAYYMQFYSGGVSDPAHCSDTMDHGVLVVGYGVDKGVPFWTIKNSWGPDWGEKGYYRIVRGKAKCGLSQDVSVPRLVPS